jgi:hypothetical protein
MDLPNWLSLERVGRPDFRAATGLLILGDFLRQNRNILLPTGRAVGETDYDARVISDFGWQQTIIGSGLVRDLIRGVGLFPYLDEEDGTVKHAILFADEGSQTIQVDFTSAADGVAQAVYVRFIYSPATFANRVFWNPSAGPAAEYINNIATRLVPQWEVTFQAATLPSPGDEWVKIWEITKSTGPSEITAATDFRHFFFEGSANATDDYGHEWGDGANDRDANRALYGVNDFHLILQAIRRQLADIIGDPAANHRWEKVPAIELLSLNRDHYSEADNATHKGKHKTNMEIGDESIPAFWKLQVDASSFAKIAQNDPYGTMTEVLYGLDASDDGGILWAVRGALTAMSDGDTFSLYPGSITDFQQKFSRVNSVLGNMGLWFQGSQYGGFNFGTTSTEPGFTVQLAGHSYHVPDNERGMFLSLDTFRESSGSGWYKSGPADANVALAGAYVDLTTATADDEIFVEIRDFPEKATLAKIQVMWFQSALGGGAREMRMYAARHTLPVGNKTDGDVLPGSRWTVQSLKSTVPADYIEYALSVQLTNVLTFTCNQNHTNWTKDADKLVIGFRSPDNAVTCAVYSVRLYWIYSDTNPWPINY